MLKITGLDELKKKLEGLKGLEKSTQIAEVLTPDFMQKNSKFKSVEEMFKKSGFNVTTNEDFEKIPETELNAFVAQNTNFKNWSEMLKAATEMWVQKQME